MKELQETQDAAMQEVTPEIRDSTHESVIDTPCGSSIPMLQSHSYCLYHTHGVEQVLRSSPEFLGNVDNEAHQHKSGGATKRLVFRRGSQD